MFFIGGLFITFALSSYIHDRYLPYFIYINEYVFIIGAVATYILIYNHFFVFIK